MAEDTASAEVWVLVPAFQSLLVISDGPEQGVYIQRVKTVKIFRA
jgi:hypothetical protein